MLCYIDAFQDSNTGFPIKYRFVGNILNLRRWQAKTKVQTDVLHVDERLYADDLDKNAISEAKNAKSHVITMISQSAQKRQRLYTNQHLENRTMNQPSL